jgi:hypothetical protein
MNNSGCFHTIASCEGHVGTGLPPYVYFSCSVRNAIRFARLIDQLWRQSTNPLIKQWKISGIVCEKVGLKFYLHAPSYELASQSFIMSFIDFEMKKASVTSDLQTLALMVTEQFRQNGKKNKNEQ